MSHETNKDRPSAKLIGAILALAGSILTGVFLLVIEYKSGFFHTRPSQNTQEIRAREGSDRNQGQALRIGPADSRIDGLWVTTGGQTYAIRSEGEKVDFDGVDAYGLRILGQGSLVGREIEAFYSRGDGSMGMLRMTVSPDFQTIQGQATNMTYGTVEAFTLLRK